MRHRATPRLIRRPGAAWFAEAPAERLALLRVLVGIWTLLHFGRRWKMLARVARTDPALFEPVGVVKVLDRPLDPAAFRALQAATHAANVAFVLGWRHQATGPLFAGSLLFLCSYRNSWSMIYHSDNVAVLHVLALGLSPAADALSLDARRAGGGAARGWRYGWPIQLIRTVTALTYFVAGVAKLKGPLGRRWATGEALRSQVLVDGLRKELLGEGAAPLAYTLYPRLGLFRALAVGSLLLELGAPAALLDRRLARLWAANVFLMHWGIYLVMRIKFRYQLTGLVFAPFFEVERIAAATPLRTRPAARRPAAPGRGGGRRTARRARPRAQRRLRR
jgi:hypothetical protein